ncbi:MAG: biotin/lipoyl-binding protein, partial [Cellvibrionaceae bacterium]
MNRPRMSKHVTVILISILGAALATSGCNPNQAANAANKKPDNEQAFTVEVAAVWRGDIQQTYATITTLEAEREAKIVARTSGILQQILVEEGDFVEEGQVLAQLDTEQLQLQVAQLEAVVERLKADLEREQTLIERKLG